MSLKTFLQEKGFIEKEPGSAEGIEKKPGEAAPQQASREIAPTYFPIQESSVQGSTTTSSADRPNAGPARQGQERVDDAFIKFFEDELTKSNFPGPDYFEFRKQMLVMHEKIGKKGTPNDVILQAVLTSFEAQNISSSQLITTAKQYKDILEKKKNDFLKGAAAEKDKQLQKRKDAMQAHQDHLNQMQTQLLQLQNQMNQLQGMIGHEQAQMETDKTLGKEGIEKIERAEKQIFLAHEFIAASIDADINQLQSA
jgi:hypothetical protein